MPIKCILGFLVGLTFVGLVSAQTTKARLHPLIACSQANGQAQAGQAAETPCQAPKEPGNTTPRDPCPPKPKDSDDIVGGTQKELACEWRNPEAVPFMLRGMEKYIHKHRSEAVSEVEKPVRDHVRKLYEDARQLSNGHNRDLDTANFLMMLASANTRNTAKMSDDSKTALINEVKAVLCSIYRDDNRRKKLRKSNSHFLQQGDLSAFQAVYELLNAVPEPKDEADVDRYLNNLESVRAAYALGDGKLAQAVAEKIRAQQ